MNSPAQILPEGHLGYGHGKEGRPFIDMFFLHIAFLHCNAPLSYSNMKRLHSMSLL